MTNPSFSQSHYNFHPESNGYTFSTEGGDKYFVYFIELSLFDDVPEHMVFTFNIERVERGSNSPLDMKIRNTILAIIDRFFIQESNAIITTCDSTDGKQRARRRLFNKWYNEFGTEEYVKKESAIDIGGVITYSALYYKKNNIFARYLEEGFDFFTALSM